MAEQIWLKEYVVDFAGLGRRSAFCFADRLVVREKINNFAGKKSRGGGKHGDINTPSDLTNESLNRPMEVDELVHNP